jgi:hypothetical protein
MLHGASIGGVAVCVTHRGHPARSRLIPSEGITPEECRATVRDAAQFGTGTGKSFGPRRDRSKGPHLR